MWELHLWCEENSLPLKTETLIDFKQLYFVFTSLSFFCASVDTNNSFNFSKIYYFCTQGTKTTNAALPWMFGKSGVPLRVMVCFIRALGFIIAMRHLICKTVKVAQKNGSPVF